LPDVRERERERERGREREKEARREKEREKEREREGIERRMTPRGNLGATSMYHRTRRK